LQRKKIPVIDHAVNGVATASKATSTVSPLLNQNHPHILRFLSHMMDLLGKNITPSFKDIYIQELTVQEFRWAEEGFAVA
jgi:hypothetical protein